MLHGYITMHGPQNIKQGDVLCLNRKVQQNYDVLRLNTTHLLMVYDDAYLLSQSISTTI
jgi:hypothetical protein